MSQQVEIHKGDGQTEGVSRGTWMGKPIEGLSREELMDALVMLGRQDQASIEQHIADLEFLGKPRYKGDMSQDLPDIKDETKGLGPWWFTGKHIDGQLEKLKLVIGKEIAPELLDTQVDFSLHASFLADSILCRVRGHIWAEQLTHYVVECPADWWQAFKARFFPRWLLRRWPVRMEVRLITLQAIYPKLRLIRPDEPCRIVAIDGESGMECGWAELPPGDHCLGHIKGQEPWPEA